MILSNEKRNPFKRSSLSSKLSSSSKTLKSNPLKHLSENVIGLESSKRQSEQFDRNNDIQSQDIFETQENSENINREDHQSEQQPQTITPNPNKFMTWYNEHKSDLQKEFPDASPKELTTQGIRRFKIELKNSRENENGGVKRKLDDGGNGSDGGGDKKISGVAKLAKFNNPN